MAESAEKAPKSGVEKDQNIKNMAALAYIIFFIPMITNKESKFAMYHANQGLVLFLLWMGLWFVSIVLAPILFFSGGLILMPLVLLGGVTLAVLGIINALNGEMKPLPVVGTINIIK